MKTRVLIRINPDVDTHLSLKVYKQRATLILALNSLDDKYILIPQLKNLFNLEPVLETNNWPPVLRADVSFQKDLLTALGSRDVDYMTSRIQMDMRRNGKYPDFYNLDNMPKIKNYIRNIVGHITDEDVRSIRDAVIAAEFS